MKNAAYRDIQYNLKYIYGLLISPSLTLMDLEGYISAYGCSAYICLSTPLLSMILDILLSNIIDYRSLDKLKCMEMCASAFPPSHPHTDDFKMALKVPYFNWFMML